MKMFHWGWCEFNGQYAAGDLIVMAETLGEAREKALKAGKKYLKDLYDYDQSRYNEKVKELEADIAKTPRSGDKVIMIGGSA